MLSSSRDLLHGLRRGLGDSAMASSAERREILIVGTANSSNVIAELAVCLAATGRAGELTKRMDVDF
jgi:hypothetical protein